MSSAQQAAAAAAAASDNGARPPSAAMQAAANAHDAWQQGRAKDGGPQQGGGGGGGGTPNRRRDEVPKQPSVAPLAAGERRGGGTVTLGRGDWSRDQDFYLLLAPDCVVVNTTEEYADFSRAQFAMRYFAPSVRRRVGLMPTLNHKIYELDANWSNPGIEMHAGDYVLVGGDVDQVGAGTVLPLPRNVQPSGRFGIALREDCAGGMALLGAMLDGGSAMVPTARFMGVQMAVRQDSRRPSVYWVTMLCPLLMITDTVHPGEPVVVKI